MEKLVNEPDQEDNSDTDDEDCWNIDEHALDLDSLFHAVVLTRQQWRNTDNAESIQYTLLSHSQYFLDKQMIELT